MRRRIEIYDGEDGKRSASAKRQVSARPHLQVEKSRDYRGDTAGGQGENDSDNFKLLDRRIGHEESKHQERRHEDDAEGEGQD